MKISKLLGATAPLTLAAALLASGSAGIAQTAPARHVNPLLTASTLPFQAPPFDRIQDGDYQPALEQGMAVQLKEIAAIANNRAPATFANTIAPMERSGRLLERASLAFQGVAGANTNDAIQKVEADEAPKFAQHHDAIFLNPKLFARVNAIYAKRKSLKLTSEQRMLLDVYEQQFIHAGAQLKNADKAKLRELNTQISTLETQFQQTLLAGAKAGALVVDDKARLAGLSDGEIAAAADAAKDRKLDGKWVLPLQNTTQQPKLGSLTDRATREALFKASWTRTTRGDANDTRGIISQLAWLRAQKAKLLGFPTWADYVLSDQMAKTPQAAEAFMAQLVPATAAAERREAGEIQAMIKSGGENFELRPWDWEMYSEKVRKAKYDLDEEQVKPYFEIDRVLKDGVFFAAHELYGLNFKERHDLPVYQPDVRVFEVTEANGKTVGLMYFDYWKRDNKAGGAWMSNFVNQSYLLGTKPVIYNVGNFSKPAAGQPALITFDDVTTMFHEFGHALHGLFASQMYPTLSGTSVARDFVEFPSQFNEHWALDPKVLAHYAHHYQTGAPMPAELVAKIKNAATFNQGYAVGEVIAAAELDMKWHAITADMPKQDADKFESNALDKMGLDIADVPPRYRSSYFLHIWSNGYSAGYYAYLWTKMLDDDAFAWFTKHGGLTRANGQRFRDMILSKGHTMDYGPMFRAFYGKDTDIGPLLEDYGFAGK